nr:hypothetical protein [Tanacetum cinerariifolium]
GVTWWSKWWQRLLPWWQQRLARGGVGCHGEGGLDRSGDEKYFWGSSENLAGKFFRQRRPTAAAGRSSRAEGSPFEPSLCDSTLVFKFTRQNSSKSNTSNSQLELLWDSFATIDDRTLTFRG